LGDEVDIAVGDLLDANQQTCGDLLGGREGVLSVVQGLPQRGEKGPALPFQDNRFLNENLFGAGVVAVGEGDDGLPLEEDSRIVVDF
jgi:hypothetical protein